MGIIQQKWQTQRESLLESGEQLAMAFATDNYSPTPLPPGKKVVAEAYQQLAHSFVQTYGGFGNAPKFPMPHQLMFLLRCHHLGIGGSPLEMVEQTLTAMYKGGIYDHIGGGFSRYSTDEKWLAPHFEKMLYDNALLVIALVECYQITGNKLYKGIVERTLGYIRREMTSPEGGFYSAQDADSEGEEGKFYTFIKSEILDVLEPEQGELFCQHYGISERGNFQGQNILNMLHHKTAALPDKTIEQQLEKLLQYRNRRYHLHKDDKILTSWNAMMVAACAIAGRVLDQQDYLDMAISAYQFIRKNLTGKDGALLVSHRDGKSKGTGLLDDYAFLAWACLELYQSTLETDYLQQACFLMRQVINRFAREDGGFFLSPFDGETLLFRPIEQYDGAVPSGNSVAAWCLMRLTALTGEAEWRDAAGKQLESYSNLFRQHPVSCTFALIALQLECYPTQELLCVLPDGADQKGLSQTWGMSFYPQMSLLVKKSENAEPLASLAPFSQAYPIGKQSAFYLCQNHSCAAPVGIIEDALKML